LSTPPASTQLPPVRSVLPHREPFLFIDRVLELSEDSVVAVRTFREDEPFFAGHFPGHPIVPGVLLVEGMAQAMAYCALVNRPATRIYLVAIDRARFRSPVLPGSEVTFRVRIDGERFGITTGHGQVSVGERRVADAILRGYSGEPDRLPE
jgi:3-hydroxymyristoyl/3-hydroxydecanoyl-(acyl carrier protein) dehydratase